jgi:hypothetical protein
MNISHTSKLFYGKYAYRITVKFDYPAANSLDASSYTHVRQLKQWCDAHVGSTKLVRQFSHAYSHHGGWNVVIYASSELDRDTIISHFGADVIAVCQPLDKHHEQLLDVKNRIEVKDRLIYGKYNHVVYFKYDRYRQTKRKITELLANSDTSRVTGSSSWCKVYSTNEDDVTMIKLMWPELIDYVKRVIVPTP